MSNELSIQFFKKLSEGGKKGKVEKLGNLLGIKHDIAFILKHISQETSLLDIGSGSGLIINELADKVLDITAVEPVEFFSSQIIRNKNIKVEKCSIQAYRAQKQFDLVTCFGVLHYFNREEIVPIYKELYHALKSSGKIIVKNQFGIHETVIVDGYSEKLGTDYYAQYRHLQLEIELLKDAGFSHIETFDIYPPELNTWENTHYYAITGIKS